MTKKEIKRLEKSIKKLEKCDGNCKDCEHAQTKTASGGRDIYYAFYCDTDESIQPLSNTLKNLKLETMEALQLELA